MSSKHVLQFFSLFLLSSTATGQLDAYTCDRQSKSNVGDLLDKVISVEYCLDADPVPSSIFESSPYNALTLVVENDFNPVIFHLEGGMYIGADGFYINSVFVYPRDECKQSAKQSKRDKGSNKKHARQLKGETKPAPSCTKYPNGAILVDAPASFGTGYGARLNKFLATRGATLQVMILTHEHWDHMGGVHNVIAANPNLNFFVAGEEVVDTLRKYETLTFENERVNQIYRSNPLYQRSLTFDLQIQENTEITFTRGNQTLRIMSGFGHTPGNLVIWNEATAALINIDALVYPKYATYFSFAAGNDIPMLYKLFDFYRQYPFKYFINGHLNHIGTAEDVKLGERFVVDILDAAYRAQTEAYANSTSLANFANILKNTVNIYSGHNAGNGLLAFREFLNQVAWNCVDIVLDPSQVYSKTKWVDELASVRSTLFSQCRALAQSLRIQLPGIS